ncbi:MAG TPA: hypothetical protein VEC59_08285 [Steroidobacteraceae bacterium]|nr:hypothetical protein [Steroidobacteraceae bacterium]
MRRAVLIMVAALLAGCAATAAKPQRQPAAATPAAHGVQCREERATGSLITQTVCTTPQERARQATDLEETKDWLSKSKAGPER